MSEYKREIAVAVTVSVIAVLAIATVTSYILPSGGGVVTPINGFDVFVTCAQAQSEHPTTNCVSVSVEPGSLTIARGTSVTVPLTVVVTAGQNQQPHLTIQLIGNGGDNSTGVILNNGTSLSFNRYMSFSPSTLNVSDGVEGHATLTITIPTNFPSELVGKQLQFNIITNVPGAPNGSWIGTGVFYVQSSLSVVVT
jgi:hypothetical protein